MSETLGELLVPFEDDSPELAVVLVDDLEMQRVAVAWQHLPKSWRIPRRSMPAAEAERWLWIWEGVDYDTHELARAAGVAPTVRAVDKMRTLVAVRAVLPDGRVKRSALGYIRARLAREAGL